MIVNRSRQQKNKRARVEPGVAIVGSNTGRASSSLATASRNYNEDNEKMVVMVISISSKTTENTK